MKQLVMSQLKAEPAIAEVVSDRIYGQSALGEGDVPAYPEKPFMIVTFGVDNAFPAYMQNESRPMTSAVQVYAYQEKGSYSTINDLLKQVRETLLSLPGQESPSGLYRCTNLSWGGISAEGRDEDYNANMRYLSAELVGSQH